MKLVRKGYRSWFGAMALAAMAPLAAASDATSLVGIHWWGWTPGQPIDAAPMTLLDLPDHAAWCTETVLTHSVPWWAPSYFSDLYTQLAARNVSLLTRVDFTWDETIPPPANPNAPAWPATVAQQVVQVLRHGSRFWIVGNEPNIVTSPGSLWPSRQIPPAQYASTYRAVRHAIRTLASPSPQGPHMVLLAGPSPGGVIPGVRWMDGNQYLGQVLASIPADEVDGFALHAYGGTGASFLAEIQAQLNVLAQYGHQSKPVWISEFNRAVHSDADEANSAQFVRDAFAAVHQWNQTPGAHNIVGMTWFVYDANQQAGGGWGSYAIEHWRDRGFPAGDSRDLFTAFQQVVDQRYPAGRWGTSPMQTVILNPSFESGLDAWGSWGQVDGAQSGPWFAGIDPYAGAKFLGTATNGGAKNGGVLQRVGVVPGTTYTAAAWVRTYRQGSSGVQSRIGLDRAGGVSPTAPSVVWSPWTSAEDGWRQVRVSAMANAATLTVLLEHRQSANNAWNVNAADLVQLAPGASVLTGQVQLQGRSDPTGRRIDLELRGPGGEVIRGIPLNSVGTFQVMTPLRGTFDIVARAPGWLSRSIGARAVGNAGLGGLAFRLLTGDIVRDNAIDIDDFLALAAAYDTRLGEPRFHPNADLNFDGAIDIDDYLLLASNYGASGD